MRQFLQTAILLLYYIQCANQDRALEEISASLDIGLIRFWISRSVRVSSFYRECPYSPSSCILHLLTISVKFSTMIRGAITHCVHPDWASGREFSANIIICIVEYSIRNLSTCHSSATVFTFTFVQDCGGRIFLAGHPVRYTPQECAY